MQKITPFLWFDSRAEEAAKFYTSVFKNSKIGNVTRYDAEGAKVSGQKEGTVMTVEYEIEGQKFTAINGGPAFTINEAISFVIDCKDQKEVDYYWDALTADGGEEVQCGWLKDKFGVSWQVVPRALTKLMNDKDPEKAGRVMAAMLQMVKIDVAKLEEAYKGKAAK